MPSRSARKLNAKLSSINTKVVSTIFCIVVLIVSFSFMMFMLQKDSDTVAAPNDAETNVLTTPSGSVGVQKTIVAPTLENNGSTQEVSSSAQKRLNDGTILSFGDLKSSTVVTVISHPKDVVTGGKYDITPIIPLVEQNKIRLNLYLYSSDVNQHMGVSSLVHNAACLVAQDDDTSNVNVLTAVLDGASQFEGAEDHTIMREKMKIPEDMECLPVSEEAAVSTENNTKHFLNHFATVIPNIVVVRDTAYINQDFNEEKWRSVLPMDNLTTLEEPIATDQNIPEPITDPGIVQEPGSMQE